MKKQLDRRSFIKFSALAGGGLLVGVYTKSEVLAQRGGPGGAPAPVNPNVYITVHPDNTFTLIAKNPETGQGMRNALPMIIADEFDVDWKQVKVQQADLNGALYGSQIEGGSTAIPTNYTPMRQVGAAARTMMVATAAKQWNVPETELTTGSGMVKHARTNKSATYASLADAAMKMPPIAVADIKLKDPKDFKILGTRVPGVDNFAIVTGKPAFSIDVNPPGMLYAVYQKCPTFGGKVTSANVEEVKKQPGVKYVFVIEPPAPAAPGAGGGRGGGGGGGVTWAGGVAIVADTWWQAHNARNKVLKVEWDRGPVQTQSTAGYQAQIKGLAAKASQEPAAAGAGPGGARSAKEGDAEAAFKTAAKTIEAEYEFPLLSHAPLEPQNSTAWFKDGKIEIWSPAQIPSANDAAVPSGVQVSDVTFHMVRAGGGFGRRLYKEYDVEVSKIARLVADERQKAGQPSVPVKLLWSREDDIAHDDYRPAAYHYFKAGLDASGKLLAFRDMVASYGNTSVVPTGEFPRGFVENFWVSDNQFGPFGIPTGAMRAPAFNGTSFVMQSFIDEIAIAAGKDPLQYRLDLLNNPTATYRPPQNRTGANAPFNAARAKAVLEAVRDMSNWNNRSKLPKGTGMGVSFQYAHSGYVAYVCQVSVDASKKLKVDKAWAAVDIGEQIVNASEAENLVQGGFVEGMSHLMAWEITIENGAVVQTNFNQYQPTRMKQVAPGQIQVKFLKSDYTPTGLGEPSLPPAPAAITNAIFAATGIRIRALPIAKAGYAWA